jgi:lipooligosaccharide transport system ATP-binding protein
VATGSPKELIKKETPGFVGIFEADQERTVKAHLSPNWHTFVQARQYCVRAPRIEDFITLQAASGVLAIQLRPANLEDVYLKLTGEELSDDA